MVTFASNADKNKGVLKLDAAALTALNKTFNDFSAGLVATNAAKAALKSATSAKNANKRTAKALIAQYAKTWRADLNIPDSVLDSMLVPNHQSQGTKTPPAQPLNLSMKVSNVGVITLKWDRNGNKGGTIYSVETADSSTGVWSTFDVTTRSRMAYPGTPGVEVWFRVAAKRNGQTSSYSLPVSLWATGGTTVDLEIAA
jgi:hypothetical protein